MDRKLGIHTRRHNALHALLTGDARSVPFELRNIPDYLLQDIGLPERAQFERRASRPGLYMFPFRNWPTPTTESSPL